MNREICKSLEVEIVKNHVHFQRSTLGLTKICFGCPSHKFRLSHPTGRVSINIVTDCEHLLIDGYNVIYSWPTLRKALQQGSEVARVNLAGAVRVIHDFEGVRTTIVYDGRGEAIEIERPSPYLTFSFLFTPAQMSADEVIEQMVNHAKTPEKMVVVTRDHMMVETVCALGARAITPDELEDWIRACECSQSDKLKRRQKRVEMQWKKG